VYFYHNKLQNFYKGRKIESFTGFSSFSIAIFGKNKIA